MSLPRLASVLIFLFCGTMTTLLVRSVLYPENSDLAEIPSNVPFDLFSARSEGTILDIWEGNQITGSCEFTPVSGISPLRRKDKVKVRLAVRIKLRQKMMDSDRLDLDGSFQLHADGRMDTTSLDFSLQGTNPPWRLHMEQGPQAEWPAVQLRRGNDVVFSWNGREPGDAASSAMVELMLKSTGMSLDSLAAKKQDAQSATSVRAGNIEAGGSTFDGYVMSSGTPDSSFRLYLSNTGEILRIDTPFTGESQLGLRLLAQSLRPKEATAPDFTVIRLPKRTP